MIFLIAIFSCSTVEIDQERSAEENKNISDQITQLAKQNKSFEEEISSLKNQLSEIQKLIADDSDSVLPNDSERQAYQESFERKMDASRKRVFTQQGVERSFSRKSSEFANSLKAPCDREFIITF